MSSKLLHDMLVPLRALSKSIDVVVPDTCYVCGELLVGDESVICAHCLLDLPRTMLHYMQDDAVLSSLATSVPVGRSAAWFRYDKGSDFARLILLMKFGNRPRLGTLLAEKFARELMPTGFFGGIDVIIPIPMYWYKRFRRGYNQTEYVAKGIGNITGLPIDTGLRAVRYHSAQARKNAEQRKSNLVGTMAYRGAVDELKGRHVLLVDDIVTTGATMQEAVRALAIDSGVGRVSILSLGRAHSFDI